MTRKRLLVRFLLLIVVAIAGFLLIAWLTAPTNITTIGRWQMIRGGETRRELEELLGAPGVDKPGHAPVGVHTMEFRFAPPELKLLPMSPGWQEWQMGNGERVGVCFDESGRVAIATRYTVREAWLDKFRRWLRLTP